MGKFQNLATRLLKNLSGYGVLFKRVTNSTDPLFPTSTTLEIPLTVYEKAVTNGDISSGLASAGDVIILASAEDFGATVPKDGDIVDTYTISKVISIKESNGVVALYKLICKKR